MSEPTNAETVAGNVLIQGGAALIASIAATPVAALLPSLLQSLASRRHQERVAEDLAKIDLVLKSHRKRLDRLTDNQYKLVNELVVAVLSNTEDAKRDHLQKAISGAVEKETIDTFRATQIARAIRDATASELEFAVEHHQKKILIESTTTGPADADKYRVVRGSSEYEIVSGLLGLGMLLPAGSTWDDSGVFIFSPFTGQLVEILA